ncbi:protein Cep78 homolog isoform X2 [Eupeodes corollae]|uniref:protein Cep78 homolog isoform X2 n=1 Tax=Eupeodes corollae TaxID=290404 RepID=UPI002493BB06|nr:protein Cep78 homolog isoform X2 [Eupeodes corollae]
MVNEKKLNRCGSFHIRYLELCRAKNYPPNPAIKSKNNATSILDFFGDKLKVEDWLFVIESLRFDKIVQHLAIRLRKNIGNVIEHIDSEKKAKVFRQKPAVYTKYIFGGIIDAVTYSIQFNKNLTILCLEALPMNENYAVSIAKALSSNTQLKKISFQRSPVGDKGCEAICSSIKCLPSIETLDLSECNLTVLAAGHIGDMIKFQKICRYSEGWQKSLRYQDVDPNTISGLRVILLARNPNITDDGVRIISEVLKEDVWIKIIDMENCGITDIGANLISDCLAINESIIDFNIKNNIEVSKFIHRNIRQQLGKDDDNSEESEEKLSSTKVSMSKLKERLKFMEEQLASEKVLRKQVEHLNEKLHNQIVAYENQLAESKELEIPEGYVLVKNDSLDSIINENDLYNEASHIKEQSKAKNYLRKINKIRKVKSEMKYKQEGTSKKISKSDYKFNNNDRQKAVIFEKNIGDNLNTNCIELNLTARVEKSSKDFENNHTATSSENEEIIGEAEPFKVFMRKKQPILVQNKCPSPRSLFLGLS